MVFFLFQGLVREPDLYFMTFTMSLRHKLAIVQQFSDDACSMAFP